MAEDQDPSVPIDDPRGWKPAKAERGGDPIHLEVVAWIKSRGPKAVAVDFVS